jgi:hypothetical protein
MQRQRAREPIEAIEAQNKNKQCTWIPVPVGKKLQAGVHGANIHARVKMLLGFSDLGRGV